MELKKVIKGTLNFAEEEDWEEYKGVVNRGLVEIKEFFRKSRCIMIDYHCHLDLYKNPIAMFEEVKEEK